MGVGWGVVGGMNNNNNVKSNLRLWLRWSIDNYKSVSNAVCHNSSGHLALTNYKKQDLVFSVKLQFGKTLVSVQNKFALQKDFLFRKFWTKNKYKFQEKFFLQKIFGQKIFVYENTIHLEFLRSCQNLGP